jgi:hypothetical protein
MSVINRITAPVGRPPKITDPDALAEIRNSRELSNKELCKKFGISIPTLLKIRYSRGKYAAV